MISQGNLNYYLKTAKFKYNTGTAPNLYKGEALIVLYDNGTISYVWQNDPEKYNWSLKGIPYILKYAKVK